MATSEHGKNIMKWLHESNLEKDVLGKPTRKIFSIFGKSDNNKKKDSGSMKGMDDADMNLPENRS